MIKFKVKELLDENDMTQKQLAESTRIRPSTISAYYHNEVQRMDISHISALCRAFKLEDISELMEYSPDFYDMINQFTPLVAFENVVTQTISQHMLTSKVVDSQQDFIFTLALEAVKFIFWIPTNTSKKNIQKLGYLVIECFRYRLLSKKQLDCLVEEIEHIDSDVLLKNIADTLKSLESDIQQSEKHKNREALSSLLYNFINNRCAIENNGYLTDFFKLLTKSKNHLEDKVYSDMLKQISIVDDCD